MSQYAEVRFDDEEPIFLPATADPSVSGGIDYTATVKHAAKQRAVAFPDREPLGPMTYVCVHQHVPEVNVALVGTTFGAGAPEPVVDEGSNENDDAGEA